MVEYDPKIINDYADGLYTQSKSITTCYFFIGIFAAILVFSKISEVLAGEFDFLIMAIGVFIGGVLGLFAGKNRAFEMKLEAQQALCQIQIQENTKQKKDQKS
jgi:hypothetical protein